MTFDKFDKIPDSMLTDVTPKEGEPGKDANTITDAEAFAAADHTKVQPLGGPSTGPQPITDITGKTKVKIGSLFEGKFAVDMMDALLPALLVVLFKKMDIQVRKTELQLTESEKRTLAPVVQDCLNTLDLDFSNPWVALAFTAGIIYGSKVIEKAGVGWLDKMATKPIKEKVKEHAKEHTTGEQKPNPPGVADPQGVGTRPSAANQAGNTQVTSEANPYGFTEQQIQDKMKQLRRPRGFALGILNRQYEKKQKREVA